MTVMTTIRTKPASCFRAAPGSRAMGKLGIRTTFACKTLAPSAEDPVDLFAAIGGSLPLRARRHVDLIAKLGGNGTNLSSVLDDPGRNGDQEFGACDVVVL